MPAGADGAGPTGPRGLPGRRLAALQARLAEALESVLESRLVWSLLFLFVLTPLLIAPRLTGRVPLLPPGAIAPEDVVAPVSREFADDAATHEVREAARRAVLPIYDYDPGAQDEAAATVRRSFDEWRRVRDDLRAKRRDAPVPRAEMIRALRETPSILAPEAMIAYLAAADFGPAVQDRLLRALREVFRHRVVGGKTLLPRATPVTLRDTRGGAERREERLADVLSLDEARRLAQQALAEAGAGPEERRALAIFLSDLVAPNLAHNAALTEARRQEAEERIEPLVVRIPKGKVLLRRGEAASEEASRTLRAFNAAGSAATSGRAVLGNLLLLALLLFFMGRYVFFYRQSVRRDRHLFALMVVVMVTGLLIDRGFLWLFDHVVDTLRVEPFANPAFYRFMVPMASGAVLITLLVNPRVGMAYVLFNVPIFGMMVEWDLPLVLFGLVSNLAGIHGSSAYRQRSALVKAGLVLGAVNALAVLALQSVAGPLVSASHLLFQMSCGFAGGILVAVLVSFLLPVLEGLFNVLTDVRLLELSNLNNPLLRRLAVEAPGSYNHSVIVGTLAEAAAEAIGANALFCRVAAYYHDVGKMIKPDYFVENQRDGVNRHDRLSPHMSALVIASHVKEGYELARSSGLPQQVLDIIPQHHGTRRINYFYQKARQGDPEEPEEIEDSDFRYPGPKPQTKEAAIFMLSDSIEAAARTLENPSPARFKGLIRRIVSDVVLDDQFDECDLTFQDLEKVCASFLMTLGSIYHHRIDYPGFDFDKVPERPFRGSKSHEAHPPPATRWGR